MPVGDGRAKIHHVGCYITDRAMAQKQQFNWKKVS
jgi:hypothetical protein